MIPVRVAPIRIREVDEFTTGHGSDARVAGTDRAKEFYAAYEHYSGLLRTWLVAYGIGAPVLMLTNEKLWDALGTSGSSRYIAICFLFGVGLQVLLATLNKTIMWASHYAEGHSEFQTTRRFKMAKWLRGGRQ